MEGKKNSVMYDDFVVINAVGARVTGLVNGDFTRSLYNPSNTEVSGAITVTITELGGGSYRASYTPTSSGLWKLDIFQATYFPEGKTANHQIYDANIDTVGAKLPTNFIMGSPNAADKIVVIPQLHIPSSFDLANTATVRFAMTISSNMGAVPTTGQITPGTIGIARKAKGATSWTTIVSAGTCLKLAGFIYYDEVFDSATGYVEGDSIRLWFQNQAVVINGVTYEIAGANGIFAYTYIRETGVKEMYTKLPTNYIMGSSDVDNHDTDIDSILTYSQSISGIVSTINTNTKKLLYGDAVWHSDDGVAGTVMGVNGTMTNPSNTPADMRTLATALNLRKYKQTANSYTVGILLDDDYEFWEFAGVPNQSWIDLNGKIPRYCIFRDLIFYGVQGTRIGGIGDINTFYNCELYDVENIANILAYNCQFTDYINFAGYPYGGRNFAVLNAFDCRSNPGESTNDWVDWNIGASAAFFWCYVLGYKGDVKINDMTDGAILFDGEGELTIDSTCIAGTVVVSGNVKVTNNASGVTIVYKQIMRDDNGYVYLADTQMDIIDDIKIETDKIKNILGLSQENFKMYNQTYDTSGNMLSGKVKIYPTKTDLNADTNVIAEYTITATWTDGNCTSYKVVKE